MRTRNVSRRPQLTPGKRDTHLASHQTSLDSQAWYHEVEPVDRLLGEIAISLQLSRTNYDKTVQRYVTISRWIERDGSPLHGCVEMFYPQGSMAIGTTIAARGTDEFDIDVVAQLRLPGNVSPREAMDCLYEAVKGDTGSRYYKTTRRQTRCVTVEYRDGMHIDITPAIRRSGTPDRESWIFHDRLNAHHEVSRRLIANPYGFAEWFKERTWSDDPFVNLYMARSSEYEQALMAAHADTEPVPDQKPVSARSKAAIALQLLKRWRNVQYESRSGRCPPSIMISKIIADAAGHATNGLLEEVWHHARYLRSQFQMAHDSNALLRVSNPVCERDVLTDRWPRSLDDQTIFLNDISALIAGLDLLTNGCDLTVMRRTMTQLFGTDPTERVFADYNQNIGAAVRDGSRHSRKTGRLVVPPRTINGVDVGAAAAGTVATPKHTFYGG